MVQIYENDFDKIKEAYKLEDKKDIERLRIRAICASNWLKKYADDNFKFKINDKKDIEKMKLTEAEKEILAALKQRLSQKDYDEKELHNEFYNLSKEFKIEPKDFFRLVYRFLINKDRGPKLASFILTIGKKKIIELLNHQNLTLSGL